MRSRPIAQFLLILPSLVALGVWACSATRSNKFTILTTPGWHWRIVANRLLVEEIGPSVPVNQVTDMAAINAAGPHDGRGHYRTAYRRIDEQFWLGKMFVRLDAYAIVNDQISRQMAFYVSPRLLFLLTLPLLVIGGWCSWKNSVYWTEKRRAAGLCIGCGYDLRATPGRCPECGRDI